MEGLLAKDSLFFSYRKLIKVKILSIGWSSFGIWSLAALSSRKLQFIPRDNSLELDSKIFSGFICLHPSPSPGNSSIALIRAMELVSVHYNQRYRCGVGWYHSTI